jgi:hypothetical protein
MPRMTRPRPGGRRRVDRVLAPEYVQGLADLSLDEVRARRREADQEDADLSFLRRLLQARIDLVRAEQRARAKGGPSSHLASPGDADADLVARLTSALVDPDAPPRGLGRHLAAEPSRVDEHRRAPERAWSDVEISDVTARSDAELAAALERLGVLEREVSEVRHEVHRVADALSAETARRYREGQVDVDVVLPVEEPSPGTSGRD